MWVTIEQAGQPKESGYYPVKYDSGFKTACYTLYFNAVRGVWQFDTQDDSQTVFGNDPKDWYCEAYFAPAVWKAADPAPDPRIDGAMPERDIGPFGVLLKMNYRLNLLRKLSNIQADGPLCLSIGICSNALTETSEWAYLHACFLCWPKFSGDLGYPVPHPELNCTGAYDLCYDLWDKSTEYGLNRWELLDHCIRTLSAMEDLYD